MSVGTVSRMKPRDSSLMPKMRPVPSPLRRSSTTASAGSACEAREVTAAESTAFLGIAGILATTDLETVERVDAEDRRENEGENASAFVLFVRGAVSVGG